VRTGISSPAVVERELRSVDAVIGAALLPGALTPKLVTRPMLAGMRRGAVMVDVSIDQGGCFETSRPTTHSEPIYEVEGVLHYCVANMPGAVPHTSTYALNHATLSFVIQLADLGVVEALAANAHLRNGLNVCQGAVTHRGVAEALGYAFIDPLSAIEAARSPR
jgi:alanine dehydrogenase